MGYKVAVVGATGAVGHELLTTLAERNFPADEVVALASERSAGQQVSYGEDTVLKVQNLETFDFKGTDIALFSPGAKISAVHAPRAAKAGTIVIDNTSQFRMDHDVPLIVPEVNPQAIAGYTKRNIIANPNCSTIQMVVALKPLHDRFKIKRVVVSTYQSVSGGGKEAMDELFNQTRGIYVNDAITKEVFTKQIAFNVIPHIDMFMDDGSTKEEWKMRVETKKILDPAIEVFATCVRVPVFIGERGARHPAESAGRHRGRSPRQRGLCYAAGKRGRGRGLYQPHPQGPDREERPGLLVCLRQSAQGRGAEHGPDRRNADRDASAQGGLIPDQGS